VRLLSLAATVETIPACTALVGVDPAGAPLLLRIPSPEVRNVLISGESGCGKSSLLRAFVLTLAMFNQADTLQMVLIDPSGREFAAIAALPHVLGDVASGPAAISDCLRWLAGELERRESEQSREPCLVVAIDDMVRVASDCGKQGMALISRLTHRGREVGIHVVAASTEHGDAQVQPDSDFLVRAVACDSSKEMSRRQTWVSADEAENRAQGSFLLVTRKESIRFQSAWAGRSEIQSIVTRVVRAQGDVVEWAAVAEPSRVAFVLPEVRVEKGDPAYALIPERRSSLMGALKRTLGRLQTA
jgi:S-DNA-T family DNA segregation ATPase FtsK/SpoIIIE